MSEQGVISKKNRDGKVVWYARIVRVDGAGRKRQYTVKADNRTHARRLRDELRQKYADRGESSVEGSKMRFSELADIFEARKIKVAEYHGSNGSRRKVSGLRSIRPAQHYLAVLRLSFGRMLIRDIALSDLEDFKVLRLKTPSIRGERSIADVNRSLELLRAMLRFAVQNGWLSRSPFTSTVSLISKAEEAARDRVLSYEEEESLLAACDRGLEFTYERGGKRISALREAGRNRMKALIITALDTGMRRGELLGLTWGDIDFERQLITVTAFNSKTARERKVGMTPRTLEAIQKLQEERGGDLNDLVFGLRDNFKNAFKSLLGDAGISNLRFHDFRHTAITRMVSTGLPHTEIMKVSGHTQWSTFVRYVNQTEMSVTRIATALSAVNTVNSGEG